MISVGPWPSSRPQWVAIERPHPAFALVVPEFAEASYAIHRHRDGHGRKDIMVWGEPDSPGARLMVEIYRPGSELTRFGDPREEVSARAIELGITPNFALAEPIDTKFGNVALVDFTSKREYRTRHCLGFVRAFDEPLMQLAGWYCKANDEIIDHHVVACALDRLSASEKVDVTVRVAVRGPETPQAMIEAADVVADGPQGLVDLLRTL